VDGVAIQLQSKLTCGKIILLVQIACPIRFVRSFLSGYTPGMKTAVSVPDEVFAKAERLARRMKKSRSELFSNALAEYIARHASDDVTETMNQVCDEIGEADPFVTAASRSILENTEW
jgi:hypothetical protein